MFIFILMHIFILFQSIKLPQYFVVKKINGGGGGVVSENQKKSFISVPFTDMLFVKHC